MLGRVTLRYDPYDEEALEAWLCTRDDDALRLDLAHAFEEPPASGTRARSRVLARLTPVHQIELTL